MDAILRRGFRAVISHLRDDYTWIPRTLIFASATQPIIFISKVLIKRELLFSPLELKMTCLVQVACKIRVKLHLIKHPVVMLIDYGAIKRIVKRITMTTSSLDHTNRRLINASIYLSEYNLRIYYMPEKNNIIPTAYFYFPMKLFARE